MRAPNGAGRFPRLLHLTLLCAGVAAGTGCAMLRATVGGYGTGPDGISRPQQRLRQALVEGDFVKALAWREDDALLQLLTTGVAAYYATQYARSAGVLDTAALLADDRITASLSRNGLSLVTNDMARPYQLRRTERLFVPYYAMLSYVQLSAWEAAAVEARRLVGLLAQYGDDRDAAERGVHGAMQYLAGAVFERAGEANEAQVAYRVARMLSGALSDTIAHALGAEEGELLVVVERGFVAHRATETIELFLGESDRDSLRQHGDGRRRALARIAERVTNDGREPRHAASVLSGVSLSFGSRPDRLGRDIDDDESYLTLAYAALRRSARPWGGALRLSVDDRAVTSLSVSSVVDDASAVDANRERIGIAARAVARAVAKYAVTKTVEEKKGRVAGTIARIGASLLERADVRSWHVLPQEITIVRARVPVGTRAVRVQVGEGWAVRSVDAGNVMVRAGELTMVTLRLWRDPVSGPIATPEAAAAAAGDTRAALSSH